jgi:predicted MFS family arabinose efflux permease
MSIGASFGISLVAGPWIYSVFGLEGIFHATAIAGFVAIAVLLVFVPTPVVMCANPESRLNASRLKQVLRNPGLARTTFGIFVLHFLLMSSFIAFPAFMLASAEIDESEHYMVYFSILAVTFVLMGPFMWLSDKPRFVKLMMQSMIIFFICSNLLLSQFSGFEVLMIAMVLFFMAFNLMEVILPATVSKLAPVGSRGTAMGIYSTAQFAGAFAGGATGGYIVGEWSLSYLMYANAVICLIWFFVVGGMTGLSNLKSMSFSLGGIDQPGANNMRDALLSISGVTEVIIVEGDDVAYLKVDADQLDSQALQGLAESSSRK